MICERYWREGILLVERGLDDPHRDGCEDCARAHASRQEVVEALPLIGTDVTGDPRWQAKVWQVIDGKPARAPWRWRWQLAGALAAAAVLALWIGLDRARPQDLRPRVDIVEVSPPKRSTAAHTGDLLRVVVGQTSDVWIYRGDRLIQRCQPHEASDRCAPDPHGMIVEMVLSTPGEYRIIITMAPFSRPPSGELDDDLAALESANVVYKDERRSVH